MVVGLRQQEESVAESGLGQGQKWCPGGSGVVDSHPFINRPGVQG